MDILIYWCGLLFMAIIAFFLAVIAYAYIRDAVQCARFVRRKIKLSAFEAGTPVWRKWRIAASQWFHYLRAEDWQHPIYVYLKDSPDIRAYWPGMEAQDDEG